MTETECFREVSGRTQWFFDCNWMLFTNLGTQTSRSLVEHSRSNLVLERRQKFETVEIEKLKIFRKNNFSIKLMKIYFTQKFRQLQSNPSIFIILFSFVKNIYFPGRKF